MQRYPKKGWGIFLLILLVLFTFQTLMVIECGNSSQKPNSTQINPDQVLRSKEGLFAGLYYKWNGTFELSPDSQLWHGNLTVDYDYADIYTIWESDDNHNTTDDRIVNETTRLYNISSHWDYSGHDWLFINLNVQVGSTVPIIISYFSDRTFTVVAKQTIFQKFLGRTFTCWKLTDDWGSIAYYDIYTGILVNGTFIHPYNMGYYTIFPYKTNAFQVNLNAPKLTMGRVTPTNGSLMTEFTYSVNYSDSDNNYPTKMDVIIDGTVYPMHKTDIYDKNYTNGCIFEYSTYLNNNSHYYFFNTSDLAFSTRLPLAGSYSGPNVTHINTNQPVIYGSVTPPMGNNWTRYRFELNYSDADNNPPIYTNLTLNGTAIQMTKLTPSDLNYMDGALYYYETRLDAGTYEHFFNVSDGKYAVRDPKSSNYSVPEVLTVYWPLADDVESGENGWIRTGTPISNSTYGWHIINTTSVSPTHAWWCGDDKTGSHTENWNASLQSPLLNLTGAFNAYIVFNQKCITYYWGDFGHVEVRINGTTQWIGLGLTTGNQPIWNETTINITSYIGEYIFIRFRFESYLEDTPGWFLDNIRVVADQNYFFPTLDQGNVTPEVGNTTTNFLYSVRYTDGDNNPPVSMIVRIDGTDYPMSKQTPSDVNYRDGVVFIYQTKLANATHSYNFRASDGLFEALEPLAGTYPGPTVNYFNLNPPTLTNAGLTPTYGVANGNFLYQVTYTDIENRAPAYIRVRINSTSYTMGKQNSSDVDYTDGCIYQYSAILQEGLFIYYFNATDANYWTGNPTNGFYVGPRVALALSNNVAQTPSLSTTNTYDGFQLEIYYNDWATVAMRPPSGADFDLAFHDLYNYSDLVAESSLPGSEIEFIGINGHDYPSSTYHYATVWRVSGVGTYSIEGESSVPDYTVPGGPFSGTISSTELIDVFEMSNPIPNTPYRIDLIVPAALDLSIYVMNQTGGKSSALAHANQGGVGKNESLVVVFPNTNPFAIIFVKENTGSGSYSFRVVADTTPPDLTIQSPLSKAYSVNTIPVNLSSAAMDLQTMWYRVWNSSGWVTNNITWSVGANIILSDGNYTLFAWANDTQGYESTPKTVVFTIDTIAPSVAILSPLNQTYSDLQILINLTSGAPDLGAIWYRVFNRSLGSWLDLMNVIYTTPVLRSLPEGIYSIYAWANDTAGNVQAVATSTNFTMNTPPTAIIEAPLNITYTSSVIQINLSSSASDLHMLWYKISNRTTWVVDKTIWSEGATVTLPDGVYTLYAWANDTFGLIQLNPTNVTFSIDSTAPTALIISPMNTTYQSNLVLINLTTNELDTAALWYRLFNLSSMTWFDLNTIIWTAPNNRSLPDGSYIIYAWANDTFGNVQPTATTLYFTINAPPIAIIGAPLNITYSSQVIQINLSSSASDLHMLWYKISDGGTWVVNKTIWTQGATATLSDGIYTLYAWANDTFGLSQLEPTAITFSIDSTPPTALIISPGNQTYRSDLILINLTANGSDLATLWYRLFNLTSMSWFDLADIIWTTPTNRNLPDGSYIIYAWANDSVGNVQLIPSVLYFSVGVPPSFLVNSPLNITYNAQVIHIDISCSALDLDTIWYRIFDGNNWLTENLTWTETSEINLADGTYWAFIWANDTHGNEIGTIIVFTIHYEANGGWESWILFLIIGIGAVCTVVVVYRIKKSQKKKKTTAKPKESKSATGTFAERVKPKDLG